MDSLQSVVKFWFEDIDRSMHFKKDADFDNQLRERFGKLHEELNEGEVAIGDSTVLEVLGKIIVLDQFSRNMFRGSPKSFASDERALGFARLLLDSNKHLEIDKKYHAFIYMPFMHSEVLADQERCVELFSGDGGNQFAIMHRDIIAQFGRFPHRNAVLGRESSAEETEFLTKEGSSF